MTVESARKRKRKGQSGDTVGAREAFPGLPLDIVVTHILNWKNLPDPGDLAIIRAVSFRRTPWKRDARVPGMASQPSRRDERGVARPREVNGDCAFHK